MRRAVRARLKIFDYGRSKQGTGSYRLQEELGLRAAAAALRVLRCTSATRCRRTTRRTPKYRAADRDCGGGCRSALANWLGPFDRAQPRAERSRWPTCSTWCTACPYPPNKGDKVRSYHLLKHLAARHRVLPRHLHRRSRRRAARRQLRAAVRRHCMSTRLHPRRARLRSLAGLADRRGADAAAITADAGLQRWVERRAARAAHRRGRRVLVVDGAVRRRTAAGARCWSTSSTSTRPSGRSTPSAHRWPMSWLYRREGAQLLAYERSVAARATRAFFVTDAGSRRCSARWRRNARGRVARDQQRRRCRILLAADGSARRRIAAGRAADRVHRRDGLLAERRCRQLVRARRAAARCAQRVPGAALLHRRAASRTRRCRRWRGDGVVVTGTVPDVRPYLQHAAVVVAPLRVARGIQNKVLEAMAMARPGRRRQRRAPRRSTREPGREFEAAATRRTSSRKSCGCCCDPRHAAAASGARRRARRVLRDYSWAAHLAAHRRACWLAAPAARDAPPGVTGPCSIGPAGTHAAADDCACCSAPGARHLLGALQRCVLVVLRLFCRTAAAMVEIWRVPTPSPTPSWCRRSSLWLVWRKREALAAAAAAPAAAGCCCRWPPSALVWLLGDLVGVNAVDAVRAGRDARAGGAGGSRAGAWPRRCCSRSASCSSPCRSASSLMPQLMDWTADFTVAALRLTRRSGVPRGHAVRHPERAAGRWSRPAAACAT